MQILFSFFIPNFDVFHQQRCILFTHFDLCVLKALDLLSKRYEVMEKLYSLKTLFKMTGGGMYPSLDPPLIIVIITI